MPKHGGAMTASKVGNHKSWQCHDIMILKSVYDRGLLSFILFDGNRFLSILTDLVDFFIFDFYLKLTKNINELMLRNKATKYQRLDTNLLITFSHVTASSVIYK